MAERVGAEPTGSTDSPGANQDSEAGPRGSAGEPQGWGEQSHRLPLDAVPHPEVAIRVSSPLPGPPRTPGREQARECNMVTLRRLSFSPAF